MKKSYTRRGALGLIGGGMLLGLSNTGAFTTKQNKRSIQIRSTSDSNAMVQLVLNNPLIISSTSSSGKGNSNKNKNKNKNKNNGNKAQTVVLATVSSSLNTNIDVSISIQDSDKGVKLNTKNLSIPDGQSKSISVDIQSKKQPKQFTFVIEVSFDNSTTSTIKRDIVINYT